MDTGFVLHLDLILHRGNLGRFHYSPHKQDTSKHKTHGYSHGQVENHCQEEGYEQYGNIRLRVLEQCPECPPTAHIVGNHHKHACKTRHRDIFGQRHKEQHDKQQDHCVDHARNWSSAAIVDIGHCPCYGTCSRNSAENRSHHIRNPQGNEFRIGVVVVTDHTVRHSSRKQGLDGSKCGNGHGYREKALDSLPVERRHFSLRQMRIYREPVADSVNAGDSEAVFHNIDSHSHKYDCDQ